ncbi:hypothetical protein [Bailinhaonella thermotolerans]|uniref:hypothetical protein n=1 Tax=Bailinhaonella thermotolerans TaxID=1070861 RepID=UPI00192A661D|nr:hypothetical protein [Bailinhaonella thermotolerans]
MVESPPFPVDLVRLPGGDVMMLPAVWPVRLTPLQQLELADRLRAHALEGAPDLS